MSAVAAKVVDASSVIALMFDEPAGEGVALQIEGNSLYAPALLSFEIVNACATKLRRHPDLRDKILKAFALRGHLEIETAGVDHAGVLALAERYRLTGYDASYLWLAQRLNTELVTLDQPLGRAAAAMGLAEPR
ncbi:MAG: type II toxin-antitoxin system VapC family toxin [Stellaceae bacterium]